MLRRTRRGSLARLRGLKAVRLAPPTNAAEVPSKEGASGFVPKTSNHRNLRVRCGDIRPRLRRSRRGSGRLGGWRQHVWHEADDGRAQRARRPRGLSAQLRTPGRGHTGSLEGMRRARSPAGTRDEPAAGGLPGRTGFPLVRHSQRLAEWAADPRKLHDLLGPPSDADDQGVRLDVGGSPKTPRAAAAQDRASWDQSSFRAGRSPSS
jgi:hypothetical protein